MIIWGLEESEQHGETEVRLTVNSYAIGGNIARHFSKLVHKVCLKAIECVVVCWSRGFKIVWGECRWRKKVHECLWSVPNHQSIFFCLCLE